MTNKILSHFSEVLGFGGEINDKVIAHAEREMKHLLTPQIGDKVQVISKDFAVGTIFEISKSGKILSVLLADDTDMMDGRLGIDFILQKSVDFHESMGE